MGEANKRKGRKVKQMEGLMLLSRPPAGGDAMTRSSSRKDKLSVARKVHARLHPQQQELLYSAQEDQEMEQVVGRADLRSARLEQVPDGFIIHEAGHTGREKKFKLQDRDQSTLDAWFYAIYAAITDFERTSIPSEEMANSKFTAMVTSSLEEEATEEIELEVSCHLVLPNRALDKPSIRWKVWKTIAQLQAFDESIRSLLPAATMKRIPFPKDRKGLFRKKVKRDEVEREVAKYMEHIFAIPDLSSDTSLVSKVRHLLDFDFFFTISGENKDVTDVSTDEDIDPIVSSDPKSNETELIDTPPSDHSIDPQDRSGSSQSDEVFPIAPSDRRTTISQAMELEEDVHIDPIENSKDAKKLHKMIVSKVRELVSDDEDRVREFQDLTKDFGRGKINATEYCAFLQGCVGAIECCYLIPSMARLLPIENKREELLEARSVIVRRVKRRQRRRSKQFSESVLPKQRQTNVPQDNTRLRPQSDHISAPDIPQNTMRSSMFEDTNGVEKDTEAGRRASMGGLQDPRRKLRHRSSFNLFGEPIVEEQTAKAEEQRSTGIEYHGDDPALQDRTFSLDRQASASSADWSSRNRTRSQNCSSFKSDWTESEDEQPVSSSSRPRSRTSNSFVSHQEEEEEDASRSTYERRLGLRAQLTQQPMEDQEENPVLARLKRQGAINFTMTG